MSYLLDPTIAIKDMRSAFCTQLSANIINTSLQHVLANCHKVHGQFHKKDSRNLQKGMVHKEKRGIWRSTEIVQNKFTCVFALLWMDPLELVVGRRLWPHLSSRLIIIIIIIIIIPSLNCLSIRTSSVACLSTRAAVQRAVMKIQYKTIWQRLRQKLKSAQKVFSAKPRHLESKGIPPKTWGWNTLPGPSRPSKDGISSLDKSPLNSGGEHKFIFCWPYCVFSWSMWMFPEIVVSQNGWFIMENPI